MGPRLLPWPLPAPVLSAISGSRPMAKGDPGLALRRSARPSRRRGGGGVPGGGKRQPACIGLPTAPRLRRGRLRRPRRWHDAVAELLTLQAVYTALLEALPDTLQGTATADALQAIVELDLDTLAAIEPPLGYGAGRGRRPQGLRCAHRQAPASALDPVVLAQHVAVMPCGARRVRRRQGVSFLLCAPGDISILRRHHAAPPLTFEQG